MPSRLTAALRGDEAILVGLTLEHNLANLDGIFLKLHLGAPSNKLSEL
jgi:hypothetical protein